MNPQPLRGARARHLSLVHSSPHRRLGSQIRPDDGHTGAGGRLRAVEEPSAPETTLSDDTASFLRRALEAAAASIWMGRHGEGLIALAMLEAHHTRR